MVLARFQAQEITYTRIQHHQLIWPFNLRRKMGKVFAETAGKRDPARHRKENLTLAGWYRSHYRSSARVHWRSDSREWLPAGVPSCCRWKSRRTRQRVSTGGPCRWGCSDARRRTDTLAKDDRWPGLAAARALAIVKKQQHESEKIFLHHKDNLKCFSCVCSIFSFIDYW